VSDVWTRNPRGYVCFGRAHRVTFGNGKWPALSFAAPRKKTNACCPRIVKRKRQSPLPPSYSTFIPPSPPTFPAPYGTAA